MFEKNLKYYRLKKGLSKKALAEACSVTPMAISHYEAGARKPGMDVLEKLADALGVRLSDLLKRRNDGLVFQHGGFRKTARMTEADQEYVRESVEEYFGRFFDVVEALGGDVLPDPPACRCLTLNGDADTDAVTLRNHLLLNLVGPVHDLVGVLENCGILVFILNDTNPQFSGMNGFVNGRPYIVVNGNMTPERNRSTLVHELAHLMFRWSEDIFNVNEEKWATAISGAFLLPEADLRRELGVRRTAVTRDMQLIAEEYGVSMLLLAKRANLCGIVSDSAYRRFCMAASQADWRNNEPSRIPPEEPALFNRLVYRAVCQDDISVQKGAELLGSSFEDVAAMCSPCEA